MNIRIPIFLLPLLAVAALADYQAPAFPFAPAAGEVGSTAVAYGDPRILSWAAQVDSVVYGEDVDAVWQDPGAALGPADGGSLDVLVLGRGGQATLTFEPAIADGEGEDFAVFENGISDYFLELAFVEVSSDGIHFVRFPGYSFTAAPVPGFGTLDPTYIDGFPGKYRAGFGTPFDLQLLKEAHEAVQGDYAAFSEAYRQQLVENFPYLDTEAVKFVRLVDVVGDGSALDCEGQPVYDPHPTVGSAGFDLDAVAVLNEAGPGYPGFADWSAGHGLAADPDADSDRDGWYQWLEYKMGSSPVDGESIPVSGLQLTGEASLELVFSEVPAASGTLEIQVRNQAGEWVPFEGDVEPVSGGGEAPDGVAFRRITLPATGEAAFVRFAGSGD